MGILILVTPVASAVALENLRILDEEKIVDNVRDETAPYLTEKWAALADHPLVGEARNVGLMGAIELTPDKSARAPFASDSGTVGVICREFCFNNGLIMRHVGDKMIISPPLVISKSEIDELAEKAWKCLDLTLKAVTDEGLMKAGER